MTSDKDTTGEFMDINNPPTRIVVDPNTAMGRDQTNQWSFCNEDEHFWNNSYAVSLATIGGYYLVNADNESDALDSGVDIAEGRGYIGLFLDPADKDTAELESFGEVLYAGNHGL